MINTITYGGELKKKTKDGKEKIIQVPPTAILNNMGAFLEVTITHPGIIRKQFSQKGEAVPGKRIKALIDTGASSSVITPEVANELGLIHTGYQTVSSVQDEQKRPIYYGAIQFHWGRGKEIPFVSCPLKGNAFDGLIGRDILRHWHLTYNGPNGSITICD
jgi:predicted aspartyl protease